MHTATSTPLQWWIALCPKGLHVSKKEADIMLAVACIARAKFASVPVEKTEKIRALLIQQSECPKGHLVQVTIFDVVFDHIGMFDIFDLVLSLLLTTYFEGILAHLEV